MKIIAEKAIVDCENGHKIEDKNIEIRPVKNGLIFIGDVEFYVLLSDKSAGDEKVVQRVAVLQPFLSDGLEECCL